MPGSGCAFPLSYRTETSFPYDNKCSTRMRTRRKGRWLLKQPRLGARMCQGTFFFIILVALDKMKNVAYSL